MERMIEMLRLFCMRVFTRMKKVDRVPGAEFGIVYVKRGGELDE